MKEVLALIEKNKQNFAELPLFKFMQDKSIDPKTRLAWAPCLTPFAMNFKDFNHYVITQYPTINPIQEMINSHAKEDGRHWRWFLKDLELMELDRSMLFSDSLRFLWGEETKKTRQLCQVLFALCMYQTDPILKLVVIESIEATGNAAFPIIAEVGNELQQITGRKYSYFSQSHYAVETGHIQANIDNVEQIIESINLTEESRAQAFDLVEKVFIAFTESMDEMMTYVKTYCYKQPLVKSLTNF